ncbi:MAG TPA: monovalent cation/H(+) antiporter subunit G [Thermoanaerobaculia bacterium]|nr:monovalent cation/H(+) antiporter subunit G [Thermoanaerobaculia bacterium]
MSVVINFFLLLGSAFLLLAALGVTRMPDFYMRMSSSSKAVTLGAGCLAIGLALHMDDPGVTTRAILLMLLFFLKAPVAAHMLGRAAYMSGVPLSDKTFVDEMSGPNRVEREASLADERRSGGI